jgi:hypothetical protein
VPFCEEELMPNSQDDPRESGGETPEHSEAPDPDRPVPGDTTEYIEKGLKESEIEKLEERDE